MSRVFFGSGLLICIIFSLLWHQYTINMISLLYIFNTLSECTYKGESSLFLSLFLRSVLPFRAVFLFSSCFFSCRFLDSTSVACSVSSSLIYFYSVLLPQFFAHPLIMFSQSLSWSITSSLIMKPKPTQTTQNVMYCTVCTVNQPPVWTWSRGNQSDVIIRDLLTYWCQDLD